MHALTPSLIVLYPCVLLCPSQSHSPGSQQVVKTDLGFNKAVDALASIKLHNYAMKRREHTTQKLKVAYLG